MRQLQDLQETIDTLIDLTKTVDPDLAESFKENPRANVGKVIIARNRLWENPKEPIIATEEIVQDLMDSYAGEVQSTFSLESFELPEIIVSNKKDFLPMLNDSEDMTNSALGKGYKRLTSPPVAYHDQRLARAILPEKFLMRIPKGEYKGEKHTEFEIEESEWDMAFLELTAFGLTTQAAFRQLRNEWEQNYIPFLQAIDEKNESSIIVVHEAVVLRAKVTAVLNEHPNWGIFTAAELFTALQEKISHVTYRAVAEMHKTLGLSQIAALDVIVDTESGVQIAMDTQHPSFEKKKAIHLGE